MTSYLEIFILIVQLEQLVIFIPCVEATSQEEIVEVELIILQKFFTFDKHVSNNGQT